MLKLIYSVKCYLVKYQEVHPNLFYSYRIGALRISEHASFKFVDSSGTRCKVIQHPRLQSERGKVQKKKKKKKTTILYKINNLEFWH